MLMESIDGGIGPTEGGAAAAAETFPVMAFFDLWLASAVSVQEMAAVLFDASDLFVQKQQMELIVESLQLESTCNCALE